MGQILRPERYFHGVEKSDEPASVAHYSRAGNTIRTQITRHEERIDD